MTTQNFGLTRLAIVAAVSLSAAMATIPLPLAQENPAPDAGPRTQLRTQEQIYGSQFDDADRAQ